MKSENEDDINYFHPLRHSTGPLFSSEDNITMLKRSADSGDSEAQYKQFLKYFFGKQVEESEELYLKYMTISANQGNTLAEYRFAEYDDGSIEVSGKAVLYVLPT